MKLYTIVLLAVLAGILVYAARRRIKLALTTGVVAYVVLLLARIVFSAGEVIDRLGDLLVPAILVLVVWLALWWASTRYEQRKLAERARNGQTRQPPWRSLGRR